MQIKKIMSSPVHTVPVGTTVAEAHEIMHQNEFRHLPVIDSAGRLVGILSDRDVRNILVPFKVETEETSWMPDTRVELVMREDPTVISPSDEVQRVVQIMISGGFNCLPVVSGSDLIGIVTTVDLMKALARILDLIEKK